MPLDTFLENKDWFDNSRLDTINACKRKGFLGQLYNGGLEAGVGAGADFGTCMHAFRATYYSWWGKISESERRIKGMRSFLEQHEAHFTGPYADSLETKHTKESGLAMIDHYCDSYLLEDTLLQPVEVELAGAVEITYDPTIDPYPFDPFWYAFKIDGIHRRLTYHDLWVAEMKNTGGGVKRELTKLKLSRQPTGYVYCARQFPGADVTGCMPDVVGVLAKTRECQRDFYPKTVKDTNDWRQQTIKIVRDWRTMQAEAHAQMAAGALFVDWVNLFYQQTAECTSYGLCAFYDICRDGFSPATLAAFRPNKWNPLADSTHLERKAIETTSGILEKHVVTP